MLRPLLLATALFAATACASLWARPLVDITLVDRDTGAVLPRYHHRGRDWVPGVPGHRYAVRLANTTGERVLVVLSVDGVNAVTGETASPSQTGYVLAPWQSTEIAGWRKSLDDIAQFVFTDLPDSYAARTGRPDNVGVVGIAVFREARPEPWYEPGPPVAGNQARDAAAESGAAKAQAPAAAAGADMAQQRLGTGHGAREWSPVGRTGFERATAHPEQVTQLRYDDLDALAALGVLPRPYRRWAPGPVAFPDGFVADPPPAW